MRIRLIAALLAAGLLCAAAAYASPQFKQTSQITLTATKAGKPTGLNATLQGSDPGAVQPQGLKTLKITLPSKTKFNFKSSSIAICKASDAELLATQGGACPSKSSVGSGSAIANGAPVIPEIPEKVKVYAGKGAINLLLLPAAPGGAFLLLHGAVSGNVITAQVPVIKKGGLNIVLTTLKLSVKKIGSGSGAFITAGSCKAGKFTVKSAFTYQTGEALTLSSSSACK